MTTLTFGELLVQLRKRAGMAQIDLAAAVGYSRSLISALEQNRRQPEVAVVVQRFLPALGVEDEPQLANQLVELAAAARGERLPTDLAFAPKRLPHNKVATNFPPLPIPPTPLLGRQDDIRTIANRLLHHSGRLLTLIGPPGVGKSRLALAVAHQTQILFPDGAYFVPLATITDPTLLVGRLAHTLQLVDSGQLPRSSRPPITLGQIVQFLRRKAVLLVLDNFEQLFTASVTTISPEKTEESAVAVVTTLLAECAGVVVLATSRERLHLRAEQRYRVQPLALAPAIQIFAQRAQAVAPDFAITVENEGIIGEICRRLDCLPLAIELVAAHAALITPTTLLTRLQEQRLNLLNNGPYDLPVQQRSLRNAIHHSYQLLSASEQRAFRTLSVFVGGFDAEDALAMGVDEAMLHALVDKSMVIVAVTPQVRFVLLETLRAYGLEQLTSVGEQEDVQKQHATYFLELAENREPYRYTDADKACFEQLRRNLENLHAALHWLVHGQEIEQALRFVWALRPSWISSLLLPVDMLLVHQALALADKLWVHLLPPVGNAVTTAQRRQLDLYAKALSTVADCSISSAEALQIHQRCLTLNQITGPTDLTPILYCKLAAYAAWAGDFANTDRYNDACIAVTCTLSTLAEEARQSIIAQTLSNISLSSLERGDFGRCVTMAEQSKVIFAKINNGLGIANCLLYSGEAAIYLGDYVCADALLTEAWATIQVLDYIDGQLNGFRILGLLAAYRDDWVQAIAWWVQGIAALPLADLQTYVADFYHLLWRLAAGALHQEQPEIAAQLIGGASPLFEQMGSLWFPPIYRPEYEAIEKAVRTHLDANAFTDAYVAGRTMTMEEIIAFVQTHFVGEQKIRD